MHALATVGLMAATLAWQTPGEEGASVPAPELAVASVLVTLIDQVEAPAQEAGFLADVAVREGQLVAEGDLLAQIDDSEARQAQNRARIELEAARRLVTDDLDVQLAMKIWERARAQARRATQSVELVPKSVSEAELQELQLEVERSGLAVEKAKRDFELAQFSSSLKESDLASAEYSVERRRIVSPLAGVVVQVRRKRGEWVQPGETVVRILRIDRLRVEGFVRSEDIPGDLSGRQATLRVDAVGKPGAEFTGEVVFVAPEIDPVNGQVRVWAEFDNPDLQLRPGLRGAMTIHLDTRGESAPQPSE